jgi:hypothetical protein
MRGTVLSASVLSVGLGIFLAAIGVVHVDPGDKAIVELIELGFKRFWRDRAWLESTGLRRASCPISCPTTTYPKVR